MKSLFKNPWRSHPLKGFFKGLGVVKGEGVATAKKASPFPLKKKEKFLKCLNGGVIKANLYP